MDAHADTMAHCPVTPSILRRRGSRSRRCGTDGSSNSSSSGGNRNNSRSSSSIYVLVLVGLLHLARGSTDIGPAQTPLGPTPRPPLCDAAILPPGRVVPVHDAEALAAGKQQRSTTPCRRTAAAASAAFALPDDLPRLPKIRPIERPGFLVRHTARRGGGERWESRFLGGARSLVVGREGEGRNCCGGVSCCIPGTTRYTFCRLLKGCLLRRTVFRLF